MRHREFPHAPPVVRTSVRLLATTRRSRGALTCALQARRRCLTPLLGKALVTYLVRTCCWTGWWRLAVAVAALLILTQTAHAWRVNKEQSSDDAAGNVVRDASFEKGGWRAAAGARMAETARTGAKAGRIARAREQLDPQWVTVAGPVAPGPWLLSAWMRSRLPGIGDPNFAARLDVTWLDAQGRKLAAIRGLHIEGNWPVWQYREARLDAPAGVARARLTIHFVGSVCGWCEVDDVALTPAPAAPASATGEAKPLFARVKQRIFAPDETVGFEVVLPKQMPRPATLSAALFDSRGRPLSEAKLATITKRHRAANADVHFPAAGLPQNEWLEARIRLAADGQRWATRIGALVRPRPTEFGREADSPFGLLNGHPYTMRWIGARWRRPNFAWHDRQFELANRYGVTTVAMINDASQALHGAETIAAYAQFVEASVRKYRGMVRWWQMGNEPPLFRPGMAEKYVAVLKAGYLAAKRADRNCKVVMAGLTGLNVDPTMLARFLDAGGAKWCDVIDLHMYVPNRQMDELLARVRRNMAERGVDKPIILTEVTAALGKVLPEREKAGYVYKRYATALSHGVQQLYWFVMHWVNDLPGGFVHCGLFDVRTRAPWPAAVAYARLSDALTGAKFARREVTSDGLWIFEFRRGDRSHWVAWAEEGPPRAVRLPCAPGPARIVDVAGHVWPTRVADGLIVTLTDEPLLIDLPTAAGGIARPGVRIDPPRAMLARGSAVRLRVLGDVRGQIEYDATPGLSVQQDRLSADPDAAPGAAVLWAFATNGGVTTAALRAPVTVTEPLSIDIAPLPVLAGPPRVRVRVTNHSAGAQAGTIRLTSPLSKGERPLELSFEFADLQPGETGPLLVPLPVRAHPLGRYPFRAEAATKSGARTQTRRRLVFMAAPRFAKPPAIDGDLSEWGNTFPIVIGTDTGERHDPKDGPPKDANDLSAMAQLRWDDRALYMAVRVRDDQHRNERRDGAIWDGDGLQFGITPQPDQAGAPRAELGCALTATGPQTWAWCALPRAPTGPVQFPLAIVRRGGETVYEMAIPWRLLPGIEARAGTWLGFALLVNEQDQANRGYYGWHGGVSQPKDPQRFGQITLVDEIGGR